MKAPSKKKAAAPAPNEASDKREPTGSIRTGVPKIVAGVASMASTGQLLGGKREGPSLADALEKVMSEAVMEGIKEGLPLDSKKLRDKQLKARDEFLKKHR